jgi:hypothetical protein
MIGERLASVPTNWHAEECVANVKIPATKYEYQQLAAIPLDRLRVFGNPRGNEDSNKVDEVNVEIPSKGVARK